MRLNQFLAKAGVASRRKADLLIEAGKVRVNGKKVETLGYIIDEKIDKVEVDGREAKIGQNLIYILLNKPKGYLSTAIDPFGRPIVLDLLPEVKERIFPVGRLDLDSEGVLLLTNDGDLAYTLTHPKFEIEKVYQVKVKGEVSPNNIEKLNKGVILEEGIKANAQVKVIQIKKEITELEVTLKEGRKREIKRIFSALGHKVVELVRKRFATLTCKGLKSGEWRYLSKEEIDGLKKMSLK